MRNVKTLTALALEGAADRHWYDTARTTINTLASHYIVTPEYAASIAAVLSPRISVSRNVTLLTAFLSTFHWKPEPPITCSDMISSLSGFASDHGVLPATISALRHYLTTGRIRGPKTSQFAAALAGNDNACPLDIWMARALEVSQASLSRRGPRALAVSRITQAAHALSWPIASTQAALWAAAYRRHFTAPILPSFTLTE